MLLSPDALLAIDRAHVWHPHSCMTDPVRCDWSTPPGVCGSTWPVTARSCPALRRGVRGPRLVTGTLDLHACLEAELAGLCRQPAALVFSSGYLANLGVVTALTDRDTLIVSDAHVHASLVDACRLSRARVTVVPHGDLAAIDAALACRAEPHAVVLVESVTRCSATPPRSRLSLT